MTKEQITHLNWTRIGVIIGVLVAFWVLLTAATGLLDNRFLRKSTYRADQVADSAWKAEQRAMTLDVLCAKAVDPHNRRCR